MLKPERARQDPLEPRPVHIGLRLARVVAEVRPQLTPPPARKASASLGSWMAEADSIRASGAR